MNTDRPNKIPLWVRVFGVLIGFPFLVALSRAVLAIWFGRLIADVSVIFALIVLCLVLHLNRKDRGRRATHSPMTKEDKVQEQREEEKTEGILFAMFGIVLLAGTFFGFCGALGATPAQYSSMPAAYWFFRIGLAAIGLVCLPFAFICFWESKYEFLRAMGRKPPRSGSASLTSALCVLLIVIVVSFAIDKVFHL